MFGSEENVTGDLKKWLDFDRIVRREEERKVTQGQRPKTKFTYEFTKEDWISMLGLLPDVLQELDHEILEQKQKIKSLENKNEEIKKKVTSADSQVYTV